MVDQPRVRALLAQMLELGPEDAQLPLPILVNLHRRQLRIPLEAVAHMASDPGKDLLEALASLYPNVSGDHFNDQDRIAIAETMAERFDNRPGGVWRLLQEQTRSQEALGRVINMAQTSWLVHEPALALYELSLSPLPLGSAELLEVELDLSPAAHAMLIDLYHRGQAASLLYLSHD